MDRFGVFSFITTKIEFWERTLFKLICRGDFKTHYVKFSDFSYF